MISGGRFRKKNPLAEWFQASTMPIPSQALSKSVCPLALSASQGRRLQLYRAAAFRRLNSDTVQMREARACAAGDGPIRIFKDGYKDRVKNFWQGRGEGYDVNNNFHPPLCVYLVHLAGISPGSAVLDVATGTGSVAFAAADVVGPSGRVLGVDITDAMLTQVGCASSLPNASMNILVVRSTYTFVCIWWTNVIRLDRSICPTEGGRTDRRRKPRRTRPVQPTWIFCSRMQRPSLSQNTAST